jgi:hypothetical protein
LNRPARRVRLGKAYSWVERQSVYLTAEALEVDHVDSLEVNRRRVFFDEVLLVTLHAQTGVASLLVGSAAGAALTGWLAYLTRSESRARAVFLGLTALFLLVLGAAAFLRTWTVTVYGRRALARLQFRMRAERARLVYQDLCRRAEEAQRALAERLAAAAPPAAAPPLPPAAEGEPPLPPPGTEPLTAGS